MSAADIIAVGSDSNAPTSGKVCQRRGANYLQKAYRTRHTGIEVPQNQQIPLLAQTRLAGHIMYSRSLGREIASSIATLSKRHTTWF